MSSTVNSESPEVSRGNSTGIVCNLIKTSTILLHICIYKVFTNTHAFCHAREYGPSIHAELISPAGAAVSKAHSRGSLNRYFPLVENNDKVAIKGKLSLNVFVHGER